MDKTITIEVVSEGRTQRIRVVVGKSVTLFSEGQERTYEKGDLARYGFCRGVSAVGRIAEVTEQKVVLEDYRRTYLDFLRFDQFNWDFDNTKVKTIGMFKG